MRTRLAHLWNALLSTFWFIPGVMLLAAAGLAFGMLNLDARLDQDVSKSVLGFSGSPEGARNLLAAVAGSIITVASLVFSLTMITLTQAASQFGPRLLRNFMRSRANQLVLGTFVATFIYCVLVLRAVRAGDGPMNEAVVPHTSVSVAIALAVASIGVLVYFIDHTARSLQAPHVIAGVADELRAGIDQLFPEDEGRPAAGAADDARNDDFDAQREHDFARQVERDGRVVRAKGVGYIQVMDADRLLELARERDARVRMLVRPGQFVVRGLPIAVVSPPAAAGEEFCDAANAALILGRERTEEQDVEYAVDELVEIAVRALSPGINDPFTAKNCIDQLSASAAILARRPIPSRLRADDRGTPRLLVMATDFDGLCDSMFNMIRQNCARDAAVSIRMLDAIARVLQALEDPRQAPGADDGRARPAPGIPPERLATLLRHARQMHDDALTHPHSPPDRQDIQVRHGTIVRRYAHWGRQEQQSPPPAG